MDLPEGEASPVCPKGYLGWHYLFTEIEEQSDANSYHNLNLPGHLLYDELKHMFRIV